MLDSRTSGVIGGAGRGAAIGAKFGGYGAAIGAVAGGLFGGVFGGDDDDAKELAEMQVREIERAYEENKRIKGMEIARTLGLARASVGASNIQFSGSPKTYIEKMGETYRREMAWDTQRNRMQVRMARLGGQMAADQVRSDTLRWAIGGIGSAAQSGVFGTFEGGEYKAPWV